MTEKIMGALLDAVVDGVRERVNLTKFFRRNACAKHGVPWTEDEQQAIPINLTVKHEGQTSSSESTSQAAVVPPAVVPSPQPSVTAQQQSQPATVQQSLLRKAIPWITAIGVSGGGGGALGYLATYLGSKPPAVTEADKDVEKVAEKKSGSLYQYLEDNGYHLPEKAK